MKAVFTHSFESSGSLKLGLRSLPHIPSALSKTRIPSAVPSKLSSSLVLIKCVASAVNRGDLLQRRGKYPAPTSENPLTQEHDVCGLEASGYIVDKGNKVKNLILGEPVTALLTGGGYGEYVLVDQSAVISVKGQLKTWSYKILRKGPEKAFSISNLKEITPKASELDRLRLMYASCLPEAYLTAFQCLFIEHPNGGIKPGDNVLIHSGASGVGLAAIRLCRAYGAVPHASVRSPQKADVCRKLGALHIYDFTSPLENYDMKAFDPMPKESSMNFVLDTVFGSNYFKRSVSLLKTDGVYTVISFLGGCKIPESTPNSGNMADMVAKSVVNFAPLLIKRNKIVFTTLRSRSIRYKKHLIKKFNKFLKKRNSQISLDPIWTEETNEGCLNNSRIQSGSSDKWIRPIIYKSLPFMSESNQKDMSNLRADDTSECLLDAHNVHKAHDMLDRNQTIGKVLLYW